MGIPLYRIPFSDIPKFILSLAKSLHTYIHTSYIHTPKFPRNVPAMQLRSGVATRGGPAAAVKAIRLCWAQQAGRGSDA